MVYVNLSCIIISSYFAGKANRTLGKVINWIAVVLNSICVIAQLAK